MELGGLGIADMENQNALHYEGILTPSDKALKSKDWSLLDHYSNIIVDRKIELSGFSKYLCVDGFFPKSVL